MSTKNNSSGSNNRDARLKQALKANLQRRKAQAKARAVGAEDDNGETDTEAQLDKGADQNG